MEEPVCPHLSPPKFQLKIVRLSLEKLDQGEQLFIRMSLFCPDCDQPYGFRGHPGLSTNEPAVGLDGTTILIPVDPPLDEEETEEEAEPNDLMN